jgi:hypothetical protein
MNDRPMLKCKRCGEAFGLLRADDDAIAAHAAECYLVSPQKLVSRDLYVAKCEPPSPRRLELQQAPPMTPVPTPEAGRAKAADAEVKDAEEQEEAAPSMPGYTSAAFLASLQLIDILAQSLDETKPEGTLTEVFLSKMTPESIKRALERVQPALAEEIARGTRMLTQGHMSEGHTLNDKFAASGTNFEYKYGTMAMFYGGLEGQIGAPNPDIFEAMRGEHMTQEPFTYWSPEKESKERTTNPKKEWDYVVKARAGDLANEFPERAQDAENRRQESPRSARGRVRASTGFRGLRRTDSDVGRQKAWTLDHFLRHPIARRAGLLKAEVVALRLYTGKRRLSPAV